jgi:hypothetical protein
MIAERSMLTHGKKSPIYEKIPDLKKLDRYLASS